MRYKVGIVVIVLVAMLFVPGIGALIDRIGNSFGIWYDMAGDTFGFETYEDRVLKVVVTLQVAGQGSPPVPQTAFQYVPTPDIDYEEAREGRIRKCRLIRCWRLHCNDRHGLPEYIVKPPWVPTWVMAYTLLRYVVPDYSGRCPSH